MNPRYLSFNASNASRIHCPLAESTTIGTPPHYQTNSGSQKRKTVSPLANANKHRHSLQIEPHILKNAQSPGIVKRLVSYYDESQNDGDHPSKHVYNRVGDFPLVQLKKTELKRNLVRSSTVRIAPPSKTIMNRDIRAAIMRSNSFQLGANVPKLLPTKMRAHDDAHQIITNHDPLPLNESAQSAKSVLDALEKNCRKRINNEELTLDRNKRICAANAPQETVVDSPSARDFVPIPSQSAKRNRDQVSPLKNNMDDLQLRKRSRLRNNALVSSLSSSQSVAKPYRPFKPSVSAPLNETFKETIASLKETISAPLTTRIDEFEEAPMKETQEFFEKAAQPPKTQEKRLHLFNRKFDSLTMRKVVQEDDDEIKISFVTPRNSTINPDAIVVREVEKEKLSMMLSGLSDGFIPPTKDFVDAPAAAAISFSTITTASTVSPIPMTVQSPSGLLSINGTIKTATVLATPKPSEGNEKIAISTSATVTTSTESSNSKPLLGFQFGASPTTNTSDSSETMSSPDASTNTSSVPLQLFGSPPTTSTDPNKSLISFTPLGKTSTVISTTPDVPVLSSITTTTAASNLSIPSTGGFTLGSGTEALKMSGGFSFGSNSSIGGFSNNTLSSITSSSASLLVATTVATSAVTSAPSFNFTTPVTTTSAFSFGQKPAPTITTSSSGISGIASYPSEGNLASTLSFIQKPETTTASGIGFSFNATPAARIAPQTTTAASTFSFGGSSQNTQAGNAAKTQAPATTTSSSFMFGSNAGFGQTNSAVPSFGQATTTAAAPIFGQTTISQALPTFGQATAAVPSFGQTASSATPSFGQTASSAAPMFGQSDSATTGFSAAPQKTETSAGMFSFSQNTAAAPAQSTTSSFPFGGASAQPTTTQPSTFSFGQNNASQASPASGGIFGRLSEKPQEAKPNAFSFGGQNQQPSQAPLFGQSNNSPAAPALFGNTKINAQPSANTFGTSEKSPFGQGFPDSFANKTNSTQNNSSFNAPAKAPSNAFSFGSNTSQQSQQQNQSASTGMFNFSNSINTSPPNNVSSSSVFGGNPTPDVSASFTFKPSTGTVSTHNAFGQNQSASAAPPAYQFNNSNQPVSNNFSTSYTFGGSSANVAQNSAPSSGFNFNAPQSAPVAGAFNFQGAQPVLTPQPSPSGGLFSIGTGGNPQRRPIRQATRRMK